jgi:hypothetical protein
VFTHVHWRRPGPDLIGPGFSKKQSEPTVMLGLRSVVDNLSEALLSDVPVPKETRRLKAGRHGLIVARLRLPMGGDKTQSGVGIQSTLRMQSPCTPPQELDFETIIRFRQYLMVTSAKGESG